MVNFFLCFAFALHFALLLCCFAALLFISFSFFGVTFWPALYKKFVSQFLLLLLLLPFAAVNTRHVQPPDQTIIIIIVIVIVIVMIIIVFQARETRRCFRYTFGQTNEQSNERTVRDELRASTDLSQAYRIMRRAPNDQQRLHAVRCRCLGRRCRRSRCPAIPEQAQQRQRERGQRERHERATNTCCCCSSIALTL